MVAFVFLLRPPDLTVVVGGTDLSLPLEEHKPDSLILHENFDSVSMQNDIALILLSSPIEFSNEKMPICLPFIYDINTWQHCWATGWGTTSSGEMLLGDLFANGGWFSGFYPFKVDVLSQEGLPTLTSTLYLHGKHIQTLTASVLPLVLCPVQEPATY